MVRPLPPQRGPPWGNNHPGATGTWLENATPSTRFLQAGRRAGRTRPSLELILMDENETAEIPASQFERAELLLHFLEEAEVTPIDLLDALACAGLKLVPDPDGECSGKYYGVLKAAIRADKAPLN